MERASIRRFMRVPNGGSCASQTAVHARPVRRFMRVSLHKCKAVRAALTLGAPLRFGDGGRGGRRAGRRTAGSETVVSAAPGCFAVVPLFHLAVSATCSCDDMATTNPWESQELFATCSEMSEGRIGGGDEKFPPLLLLVKLVVKMLLADVANVLLEK